MEASDDDSDLEEALLWTVYDQVGDHEDSTRTTLEEHPENTYTQRHLPLLGQSPTVIALFPDPPPLYNMATSQVQGRLPKTEEDCSQGFRSMLVGAAAICL